MTTAANAPYLDRAPNTVPDESNKAMETTETIIEINEPQANSTYSLSSIETSPVHTPDLDLQSIENVLSQQSGELDSSMGKSMLSLPTDQEIFEIYASLTKAEAKQQSIPSNTQPTRGGATTIFVDDDPFANFAEPSKILTSSSDTNLINEEKVTSELHLVKATEGNEKYSAITTDIDTNTELPNPITTQLILESTQLSPLPHNSNVSTCEQQSSQIFLTQFPKLITILSTHVQEKSTLIETSYSSSYDIKETTKYYCIPPILQVSETTSATKLTSTTGESNSVSEAVSEFKPEAELVSQTEKESETDNISTMNVLERDIEQIDETTIETTSEESLIKIESSTEYSNVDEDYVTEIENEDYDNDNDSENGQNEIDVIFKTLFTTYTYLTTFFEGASTAVSSHTEIVTNVITSIVGNSERQKESISTKLESSSTTTATEMVALTPSKYVIQNEFDRLLHSSAYDLESNFDELSQATLQLDDAKYTKTFYTTYTFYTTIFADSASEITSRTEVFTNYVSELLSESSSTVDVVIMSTSPNVVAVSTASIAVSNNNNKPAKEVEEKEEREKLRFVTDVRTSSSTGNHKQVIGQLLVSKDQTIEDQVSSESNTEEILPSETLLLQTSFTTFTFYTTMYEEDVTNVVSRLETVTNIVTETVQPTKLSQNQGQEDVATLPITYFTTFTYWTKLAKDGEITTISREETISNVIEPTKQQSIESYTNMTATKTITETTTLFNASNSQANAFKDYADAITTFYTTYTYYTTSYDNNNTVTDSRLETVTNIFRPTDFSISNVEQSQTEILPEISTSMLKVDASKSSLSNLIFYDYKHIIDAESVSTLYFTTNIYASINQDGTTVELTSSTSHLHVDEEKKMYLATTNSLISAVSDRSTIADGDAISLRQYKTGLVRLIEGTRIGNNTTTLYQSKVIGTIIDNRYAQIIESTSSFLFENQIEPSATSNLMDSIVMSVTESLLTLVEHDYSMMEHHGSTEINLDEEEKDITNDEDQVEIENSIDSDNNLINAQAKPPEKKRTFAPVIRPFASRNRPINRFAPKQKTQSASSATIITRLDITPTITATPALKSVGRFSSSRRIPTSNVPNNFSSPSRRLFGRPIKPSSGGTFSQIPSSNIQGSSTISTLPRNRFASSLRTAQTSNPSRRLSSSYRGSSSTNSYRISALNRNKPTIAISPTSIAKGNTDVSAEALLEEEETYGDESNAEVYVNSDDDAKANENARRQQNPLLRFRRPLNRPNGFTLANRSNVISGTSTSPRRNSLSVRTKSTTVTPTTTTSTTSTARARPRSFQRPTITNLQTAIRSNNKLFPPRGLFQKKTEKLDETGSNLKENDDSEYDDDEEMGTFTDIVEDGQDSDNGNNRRRRSQNNKKTLSRRRRQTADVLNRSRFRFRRPKTTTSEEPPQGVENHEVTEGPSTNPRLKQNARYGSRFQTHSQPSTGNSSSQSSSSSVNRGAIRPTRPTASRMQFTLREKDSSTVKGTARQGKGSSQSSTSSFRRHHQPPATSLRRVTTNSSLNSRRIKSYAHHNHNAVEPPNQRSASTSRSRNSNRNRSSATRGRTSHRNDDNSLTDLDSVTITATHLIPAEVTIPVINGQVTEYKNIVTGKPSLEVLSPHQYTQILGNNGQTSLYLTREDSSINAAGVTELTRYLLHNTMTTTVTFTPTTIRGRKTSFSHILPSTIYTVENVVTTLQPQISANAPLANILLSQLLLGNINLPANQLLGVLGQPAQGSLLATGLSLEQAPAAQPLPLTEYRTHTSTYVTTIYDGKSTILPITFQGKKILTTVFDTTAQTITATEYSIDTIIKTPTIQQQLQQQQPQVNSLLLQQLLLQQQQHNQIPQQISNTVMPQIFLGDHLQDLDGADALADAVAHMRDNIDDIIITELDGDRKSSRKKSRKSEKSQKRQKAQPAAEEEEERSVITLYVSGRRPGEFSTILSTVYNDHTSSLHKRQIQQTATMHSAADLYKAGASEQNQMIISLGNFEMAQEKGSKLDECQGNSCLIRNLNTHTASLESIVGDVDSWYASKSKKQAKTLTFRSQTTSQLSSKLLLNIF
ncbi:LOW QUALITY PROTEIN: mucin-2-like [Drosophila nasuta]|uniref:LOW QUALITY PROTEIN: mucin-2-like n=1 Tax=Drosophila nasuta TaxID=42062 RepID=UPI00295E38A9|nr:LOW QUALITY PROTEIN: mucin-2-like [Drosophila nasuta]